MKNSHTREVYNILDLIGDLGGVFDILVRFFAIFISPVAEFLFTTKAISKLFLARTNDK